MGGVSTTVYQKLAFIETSTGWATHTYQVLAALQGIIDGMVNQETGMRGYLVSGNNDFLAPYKSGETEFSDSFALAKRLTADNPQQQARLDQVSGFAATWKSDVAEKE